MKSLMETLADVSSALTQLDPEAEHHDAIALDEAGLLNPLIDSTEFVELDTD